MNLLMDIKKNPQTLKFLPKLNSELMKMAKTGIVKDKMLQKCFKIDKKNSINLIIITL